MPDREKIRPVIMCGGVGTRLWPVSREAFPKQFLDLLKTGQTLFQEAVLRVDKAGLGKPVVIAGDAHRFIVTDQLAELGIDADILLEPERKDSCAAIVAACAFLVEQTPDATALIMAADHAIPDPDAFLAHVDAATPAASHHLVTFGLKPDQPATGYGYIGPGDLLAEGAPVRQAEAFVEKPDEATAERYVSEGFLWNSGNFLFSAQLFLEEAHQHAPEIAVPAQQAVAEAVTDLHFIRLASDAFAKIQPRSVDYAVMEPSSRKAVLISDFAWSDIGSWNSVWGTAPSDPQGNVSIGPAVLDDTTNTVVHTQGALTVVSGLDNAVVVNTGDAVLVTTRERSEHIKQVTRAVSAQAPDIVTDHQKVHRPWGTYERIDGGNGYLVKRIEVKPGGILSLQSHQHRAEHWVVVSGTARVTLNGEVKDVAANHSVYVPIGGVHRIENPTAETVTLIEVQTGAILDEEDIIRYEDVYNRG